MSMRSTLVALPFLLDQKISQAILSRALKRRRNTKRLPHDTKRLLYVAASCLPYHISGYTSRTHEILKALQASGNQVHAVTRPGYPWDRRDSLALPVKDSFTHNDISYTHFRKPGILKQVACSAVSAAGMLEKYALANGISCIHAASNHVNALPALIAARRLGLPFQYEMRGLWELTRASRFPEYEKSPAFRRGLSLERYVASNADSLFVISNQLGKYVSENWNIDKQRINLLPNCVDIDRIKPELDIVSEKDTIGYAGSLMSYEGLDLLIEAIAILRARNRHIKLVLIGAGEARPMLEKLVESHQLERQIKFMGRLDPESARKVLARVSMICLPRKPFAVCKIVTPLKLIEAMALGKALITPDLPVFRDELGDLANDWSFQADNPHDLANRIEEKIGRADLLARQGEALRNHVISARQWKQHLPKLMDW